MKQKIFNFYNLIKKKKVKKNTIGKRIKLKVIVSGSVMHLKVISTKYIILYIALNKKKEGTHWWSFLINKDKNRLNI